MKLYLAGERESVINKKTGENSRWSKFVKRRLLSYYYHAVINNNQPTHDLLASIEMELDLFLDSGAYTAFTKKVDISIDDYARFINTTHQHFSVISCLDDTSKNEQVSYDNQKALESNGCKIQPVFHCREDPQWLIKYLDEGYDYILLGGMVPETTGWLRTWLDDLFRRYLTTEDGTPRVKVHGFGLTDSALMFRYPWYSVDSTSWLLTGVFGSCMFKVDNRLVKVIFSEESPKAKDRNSWHYKTLPKDMRAEVDKWLLPLEIDAEELAVNYRCRDAVNAATYTDMESMGVDRFTVSTQDTLFS